MALSHVGFPSLVFLFWQLGILTIWREHDHCKKITFSNLEAAFFLRCDRESLQKDTQFGGLTFFRSQADLFILQFWAVRSWATTLLSNFLWRIFEGQQCFNVPSCLIFKCASFGSFRFLISTILIFQRSEKHHFVDLVLSPFLVSLKIIFSINLKFLKLILVRCRSETCRHACFNFSNLKSDLNWRR